MNYDLDGFIVNPMMKGTYSFAVLVGMYGVMIWSLMMICPRFKLKDEGATLGWDAAGYYWYLPSIFIYNDLATQSNTAELIQRYHPGPDTASGFGFKTANGNTVMKYSIGMAILESPFFFIAHAAAKTLGYPQDGLSRPYQVAIQFGALLISFLGLWLIRRLLLFYYSDVIVALCLFVLVVGTNYLNYSAIDGALTHTWLFTLYALLLWYTRLFYLNKTWKSACLIGILCGLAIIIRPTEFVCIAIPVFGGLKSLTRSDLFERLQFFKSQYSKILVAMVLGGLIIFIQLAYWKSVSGHWLVYSYQDQGFSWLHPHVISYTLSYRSGWLMYTPVMILGIIGFIPLIKTSKNWVMPLIFIGLAFYFVTAWNIWWYSGMGGRAMVQYYAVLMFPIASFFSWMLKGKRAIILCTPFILVLIYVNVWFTYNAHVASGCYDAEGSMTKEYYWKVIGRWNVPDIYQKLKDGKYVYDHSMPGNARLIYQNSLHTLSSDGKDSVLIMDGNTVFSMDYNCPLNPAGYKWLRASADFEIKDKEWKSWLIPQFILGIKKDSITVRETMFRTQRLMDYGDHKTLWVDLKLPTNAAADYINVHFWNPGSKIEMKVENLKVWAF